MALLKKTCLKYGLALSFILVSSGCATKRLSPAEVEIKYKPLVDQAIQAELSKVYPKENSYWATWDLLEAKNGEPVTVERYEPEGKLSSSFIAGRDFIQSKGNVVFKQGNKEIKLKCHFAFDGKDGQVTLAKLNYDWETNKKPNPDCGALNPVVQKDPIKEFRGSPKVLRAINERQVFIGMSEDALVAAMGPMKVNEMNVRGKVTKQYVVTTGTYVYVENGKVVSTQKF